MKKVMRVTFAMCILLTGMLSCATANGKKDSGKPKSASYEQVENYIKNRMESISLTANVNDSDVGPYIDFPTAKYEKGSNTLKETVSSNVGSILFKRSDGNYEIVPLKIGEHWKIRNTDADVGQDFRWFMDKGINTDIDSVISVSGALSASDAAEVLYRRWRIYEIDPSYPYTALCAKYVVFKELADQITKSQWENYWIITGVVINHLEVKRYRKWDGETTINGQLLGVGGNLYISESTGSESREWRSYYIVSPLKAVGDSYLLERIKDEDIDQYFATIRAKTGQEKDRLTAFYNRTTNVDPEVLMSRLTQDKQLLSSLKDIEWGNAPMAYDFENALILNDIPKIRNFEKPPALPGYFEKNRMLNENQLLWQRPEINSTLRNFNLNLLKQ